MNSKNKNIRFGAIDFGADELDPRSVKIRITTMIDLELLKSLKKIAKKKGTKYQTLLNEIIRIYVEQHNEGRVVALTEARVRKIIRDELQKRA